jgi:hypothetical protein
MHLFNFLHFLSPSISRIVCGEKDDRKFEAFLEFVCRLFEASIIPCTLVYL